MTLKGLGIRKSISSGLASPIFPLRYISIIFCSLLFLCYYWIRFRICSYILTSVHSVASQLNHYIYIRLQVSGLRNSSLISQLLMIQSHMIVLLTSAVPMRSDKLLEDGTVHICHIFQIVRRARPKWCSKSTIALLLSNTYLASSTYLNTFYCKLPCYPQDYFQLNRTPVTSPVLLMYLFSFHYCFHDCFNSLSIITVY